MTQQYKALLSLSAVLCEQGTLSLSGAPLTFSGVVTHFSGTASFACVVSDDLDKEIFSINT